MSNFHQKLSEIMENMAYSMLTGQKELYKNHVRKSPDSGVTGKMF
jgi:hypothetical protein